MSILRTLSAAFGLALVTVCGGAAASGPEGPGYGEGPPPPPAPAGLYCTMSSGTSSTGREWGMISMTRTPGICCRRRVGGEAPPDFPSCHTRGHNELMCSTVVDCF